MIPKIAVLLSGRGSNLAALLEAQGNGAPYRIALVGSNQPDAPGLAIAQAAAIPVFALDHRPFGRNRQAFEAALDALIAPHDIALIALAGFMRVLTPYFVDRWAGRLINIHPSLLPAFPGRDTHQRALAAGLKLHGCTVHYVTAGVDEGPIIAQAAVPVLPDDNADTLGARVLKAEHVLYPNALALVAQKNQGDIRGFGPPPNQPLILSGWLPPALA
jgi:phosphoribosylglycinamide formyltransferase 1